MVSGTKGIATPIATTSSASKVENSRVRRRVIGMTVPAACTGAGAAFRAVTNLARGRARAGDPASVNM